jgi:DNA helicase-2/ATP-dependent DNA helicase PcrA
LNPLQGLNPQQRYAVEHLQGAQLIFAGAGSGKTKVLTHKIAHLIQNGAVRPENILAVTFTNKAAEELRSRVEMFVGNVAKSIHIGTFHAICARLLLNEIEFLGYTRQYTIYDEDNQVSLIKKVMADADIILENFNAKNVLRRISYLKNWLIGAEEFEPRRGNPLDQIIKQVYPLYQAALKRNNAVDFDDLLLLPLQIFDSKPAILKKYRSRYQYILVDEYQDTNRPQFLLIDQLAKQHHNISVVGDDDQSIYSWRGANIENILNFEKHFPECQVVKLEQNYRSTNNILKAASQVVANNQNRACKELWSQKSDGELLVRLEAQNEYDEAARIAACIQHEILRKKRKFRDFVILYRTNAQSRVLEEILRRNNIPYVIVGGVKFYERKEIRDVLAYFNIITNPKDEISLKRIIGFPPRGIGKQILNELENFATKRGISLMETFDYLDFLEFSPRSKNAIKAFRELINQAKELRSTLSLEEWTRVLIDNLGLRLYYKELGGEEALQRLANINELLNDISEFCQTEEQPTLEAYLEKVSLMTEIDKWQDEKNAVSLMTLHSAKGLEFTVVIICGLNQGLLPLDRDDSLNAFEEERRLFYVGLTRAKEKIFLSSAQIRNRAGLTQYMADSIFLREIPAELIEVSALKEGIITGRRRAVRPRKAIVVDEFGDLPRRSANCALLPGMNVAHKIFGIGKVIEINGSGPQARLKINFRTCGPKTIVAKFVTPI